MDLNPENKNNYNYSNPQKLYKVGTIFTPIVKMRSLKHKERNAIIKCFVC